MEFKKKLIEVALPLEAINAESAREKSIRHGHPSTLHLWWARRPLATARAVIWSSLVDDPSSHPELFPTEADQRRERERLFDILSRLVVWENSNNQEVLAEAKAEIMKSTDGHPPELLDPFAGGGTIPLEAQRLGLVAHAHDLNPVAVMINKAMIEIPPKFTGQHPVNPAFRKGEAGAGSGDTWEGAAGLAEDVRYYGEWMKKKAFEKIGHLYPKVKVPAEQGGGEATVIAWIWARTVKCPNPACGCMIPCASSYVLSKKKGKCAWIVPAIEGDHISFKVHTGASLPKDLAEPKKGRGAAFVCPACGETTLDEYVKREGKAHRIGEQMMAIVAESGQGRLYLSPDAEHINTACIPMPEEYPDGMLPSNPRWFSPPAFGMDTYASLFTNRQLTALTTFSALVKEAQQQAEQDAVAAGMFNDHIGLADGGQGARAYGEAVGVYLAFVVDKLVDYHNSICIWHTTGEKMANALRRQAIQMSWDFAECNPFCSSSGCITNMLKWVVSSILSLPCRIVSSVRQFDAQSDCTLRDTMVSTDPPYYDNIGYADLSDFFYVWMRQALKETYPNIFRTMLVPKAEELIATPYRHEGSMQAAKEFFEDGMYNTCVQIHKYARVDVPVTIYYAFKQSDTDEDNQTASSGWETMLSAIIKAGFAITGTWPMRTELTTALKGNVNALASSIVLVCRKRDENARSVTRREFINILHREMRPALEKLQSANIAPVDLAQSAIGPGIGVFSRYKLVLDSDGTPMSVRAALQIINQELDAFYNEQEGDLDAKSRLCVDLFSQYAFNTLKFGDADILARAKNTSVQALQDEGVMEASKGMVRLMTREEIPTVIDTDEDCCWKITQQLAHTMETGGVQACAQAVVQLKGYIAENAKALAYRLYTICERKGWAAEGYAYNNLIVAWLDIQSEAARIQAETPVQMTLFDTQL